MHKYKADSDDAKHMFNLCEEDLHLLWAAYDTGGYLLN